MEAHKVTANLESGSQRVCIWLGAEERYAFRLTSGLTEFERVALRTRYEIGCSFCERLLLQGPQPEQDKDWSGGEPQHDITGQLLLISDLSYDKDAPGSDRTESDFAEHERDRVESAGAATGRQCYDLVVSLYHRMKVRHWDEHTRNMTLAHYVVGAGRLLDILPASPPSALRALSIALSFSDVDGIAADWCLVGDDIASVMRKETTKGMPKHDTEPKQP